MNIRFTFNAKSVTIETASSQEVQITADIHDSEISDILDAFSLKDIIDHLDSTSVLNTALLLKHCTLEDVFEQFDPVELKTRLAQYLIDM